MIVNTAALPKNDEDSCIKILFADDSRLQRSMLHKILSQAGFVTVEARDGLEAVDHFQREHPDLVILDISMSGLDGIEAAQRIKKRMGGRYIPIIFITGYDTDKNLQRCIDVNADDFISKPLDPAVFVAKIRALLRVQELYKVQSQQNKALVSYKKQFQREQEVAHAVYERMIHANFVESANLRYSISPMALFNGDLVLSSQSPNGDHYLMLGDFTGHGLSASIGAGPTAETFYGMVRKGFGIGEIISEINSKLYKILPADMFLAASFICMTVETKTGSLIAAGLPDNYFKVGKTGEIRTIKSKNLPLGVVGNEHYKTDIQYFECSEDDRLILFTDGLVEAENDSGEAFGNDGVMRNLAFSLDKEDSYCQVLKKGLSIHCKGLKQQDDITIMELVCNFDTLADMENPNKQTHGRTHPMKWKTSMEFDACALRELNPVPVIVNNLMEIQGLQAFREVLFLIVTELFNNALDHGLLLLDSGLKKTPEGMVSYYRQKERRLAELSGGSIKITFNHYPFGDGGRLIIQVKDTGPGFDMENVFSNLEMKEQSFEKGLGLVKKLCHSLEYLGKGNRVKAVYDWKYD